ncbi:MAG: phosphomannomutase/phosphoglucomutase [Candidatus Limiplasma sp.]|nr:phosphomannomutase/phosphoglucomutase [Candidatus Limiplasma sp.]
MNLKAMKSGSDVRGIAIGDNATLTPEAAFTLGAAFARFVARKENKPLHRITIALGRDSRISGPALLEATAKGIASTGADAQDYGMCTTPSMYMAIITDGFSPDGSIMITASHHPWRLNGLKFFTREGGLGFHELDDLLTLGENLPTDAPAQAGAVTQKPFLERYIAHLSALIIQGVNPDVAKPLLGLHVVVDAGNGAGGFYAKMLEDLGAWIEGSQFLEPDGHFPNHSPNPENEEAMASLAAAVLRVGADVGVIFDADCDRAAIVDKTGKEINRNRLIAMISAILLDHAPGATIVTDSVTSSGLAEFIQEWGGVHYRYKRGYRNVIDEAVRLNAAGIDCPLAIETSGHAALRDNHFLDDGMYLVTLLLIKAMQLKQQDEDLGSLILGLKEPVESQEIRLPILTEQFGQTGKMVIDQVLDYATRQQNWHIAPDNREGVRISFDLHGGLNNGWFLLRLSVHDPVMPLNVESDVAGGVNIILAQLMQALEGIDGVDIAPLQKVLQAK